MATEIAKAYVQIVPKTEGIKQQLSSEFNSSGSSAGESFGTSMVGKLKGILAAAGIGAIVKEALDAGGALQQSFGGLDTLYGEASQAAKDYAREAASAGISMNDYAEQAVSFGASLKSAFEGDVTKAAEAANTAILDMADNSAKMGTDIGAVQSAYQGFAKQNYTMLDNLKLGYGGTKTEMERLLADAEKLSGVEYNIDNLGDVYAAIHVIQEDLGLTGVAAEEASETFTGSFQAMKASATNLLADLTTGGDVEADLLVLSENIRNFIMNNLVPMMANLLKQLPTLLAGAISMLIEGLNQISENADSIVKITLDLVGVLIKGLIQATPALLKAFLNLVVSAAKAFLTYDWAGLGKDLLYGIKNGIIGAVSVVVDAAKSAARSIFNAVKSFFQIGSPSKLMNKEIGRWIPAGIAIGIEDNISDVTDAMDDLSTQTLNTSIDDLTRNISYSSTISPTNNATDMQAVVSLLSQYLPNIGASIVLDSGTLVGATANKMDVALGKIATNNQRGVLFA